MWDRLAGASGGDGPDIHRCLTHHRTAGAGPTCATCCCRCWSHPHLHRGCGMAHVLFLACVLGGLPPRPRTKVGRLPTFVTACWVRGFLAPDPLHGGWGEHWLEQHRNQPTHPTNNQPRNQPRKGRAPCDGPASTGAPPGKHGTGTPARSSEHGLAGPANGA